MKKSSNRDLDHTVLKIVAGFHGLHGSFFGKSFGQYQPKL